MKHHPMSTEGLAEARAGLITYHVTEMVRGGMAREEAERRAYAIADRRLQEYLLRMTRDGRDYGLPAGSRLVIYA